MKRIITLTICLFALALSANAQDNALTKKQLAEKGITLKMAYDDYKELYDPRDYIPQEFDPYSPVGTGIASLFIPGLGQIINGEAVRGGWMLCGHILLGGTGLATLLYWITMNERGRTGTNTVAGIISVTCLCADLALDIWSIIDAANTSKIKNMYYHDCQTLRSSSLDIKLMPSLTMVPAGQGNRAAAGMTLAIKF